ncbi:hypothetical protein CRYUN_Cryun25bG0074600 [Craigia yunnanensis]
MATIDKDFGQTLSQVIHMFSDTDQFLNQLRQECNAEGAKVLQKLEGAEKMNASQADLKREIYELLTQFYQSDDDDNIHNLDLSQLQDEVLRVIGTKGKDELVGLVQGLEGFKKWIDEINEMVIELMRDLNIMPIRSIKVSRKRKKPFDSSSLANFTQEVGEETSERIKRKESANFTQDFGEGTNEEEVGEEKSERVKEKENGVLSVSDVAIQMYGFVRDIASDIEASLGHRKLIQEEMLFDQDEAAIKFIEDSDEDGEWQEKDPPGLNWVRVKKLKHRFEELKKKIFKKQEPGLNVEPKIFGAADQDPESVRPTFLRVIRNWIFHIEFDLFNFIMYEL